MTYLELADLLEFAAKALRHKHNQEINREDTDGESLPTPLSLCDIPLIGRYGLERAGYKYLEELRDKTTDELTRIRNVGFSTVVAVQKELKKRGYKLNKVDTPHPTVPE